MTVHSQHSLIAKLMKRNFEKSKVTRFCFENASWKSENENYDAGRTTPLLYLNKRCDRNPNGRANVGRSLHAAENSRPVKFQQIPRL